MSIMRSWSFRPRVVWGAAVALLGGLLALAGWSRTEPSQTPPGQPPACIQVWPEARYRNYGYDHIVHVANTCGARATCSVSSDVTPNPVRTQINAGERVEVLLERGAPAGQFTPRVTCGLVL